MRTHLIVAMTLGAVLLWARETRRRDNADAYSHGQTTCLQGNDGSGVRLRLRPTSRCEGTVSYPYLEVDIRELPIVVNKTIPISADNSAFRCMDAKESCEQSRGGAIVFDHYQELQGETLRTEGFYDLRFRTGKASGHFKVDCLLPCG